MKRFDDLAVTAVGQAFWPLFRQVGCGSRLKEILAIVDSRGLQRNTVRPRSAPVPVIWRNSRAKPLAVIETARFDPESHELSVHVSRVGLLSTRGYLHVVHTAADGARRTLAHCF